MNSTSAPKAAPSASTSTAASESASAASCAEPAREPPRFEDVARSVADRYRARAAHYYVRSKLRMDPIARALYEGGAREPYGHVLDVACGRGQLALLLLEGGFAESVIGNDWDEAKVATAKLAAQSATSARFEHADVRTASFPPADTVLLIDILHYLTPDEQDSLLVRAARATRGRLLLRDVDPSQGAASALTHGWEWITTTLGYNRGARVAPRSFDDYEAILTREGFRVSRVSCSARAMSNVLLEARR